MKTEKGLTLVEVIVALTIFLIVFLGIMQVALLSIDYNMHNVLRDEAVKVAAMRVEDTRIAPFDKVTEAILNDPNSLYNPLNNPNEPSYVPNTPVSLSACGNPPVSDAGPYPIGIKRNFRNIRDFPYGTQVTVTDIDANTKQIAVLVRWQYKNECFTHSVITLRRK